MMAVIIYNDGFRIRTITYIRTAVISVIIYNDCKKSVIIYNDQLKPVIIYNDQQFSLPFHKQTSLFV